MKSQTRSIPLKKRRFSPSLTAALIAGFFLRVISMLLTDFGYDEIMQARVSLVGLTEVAGIAKSHFGASPLDYYLCWFSHSVFGTDMSLRFPALFWGVLSILMAWRVGRRFGGKWESEAAAWLVAFCPMLVFASHLVRWYSALVFFSLLIPYTADNVIRRAGKKTFIIHAIVVAVGLYSHLFAAFSLIAYTGAVITCGILHKMFRKKPGITLRKIGFLCASSFVGFIPYLGWAYYAGVGKGSPFTPPDFSFRLFSRF